MKTTIKIGLAMLAGIVISGTALPQTLNWASLRPDDRHLINLNTGFEYGLVFGAEYGYHLRTGLPVVINLEYSFPSGKNLLDDFKSKIGSKIRLLKTGDFNFSVNIHGIYRRYENQLVRMQNFGSDFSGIAGYYRSHWYVAAEAGFDKAVVTHFKHSALYRELFPEVKNGWYEPSTGGNFYYGLQAGISVRQHDLYIKASRIVSQDFHTRPMVPYAAEIGYNLRIKSSSD